MRALRALADNRCFSDILELEEINHDGRLSVKDKRYAKNKIGWRILLVICSIMVMMWFMIPLSLSVSLNLGNITGLAVSGVLLVYGLFMPRIHRLLGQWREHKVKKWIYRCLLFGVLVVAALVVVETACMVRASCKEPEENATVVVLGCRVYGTRASLMMVERLEAAYDYLQEHESAVAVLSGGQGDGENITEAECMYRYLVDKGIEPSRLYKEEQSTSTRENLAFSKQLIEDMELAGAVAITTNEYHQYRAGQIAKSLGMGHGAISAKTAIWLLPTYYVRELYGILYEWLL